MAKDFNIALNDLVDGYRGAEEPGFRYSVVSELRALADLISKSDPWPAETRATEEAIKRGEAGISEPTEAEQKRAAADEEAAELARKRGIEDVYTSNAAPDVPEEAKEARMERLLKQERGVDDPDPVPGRPIPVTVDRPKDPEDKTKPNKEVADKLAKDQRSRRQAGCRAEGREKQEVKPRRTAEETRYLALLQRQAQVHKARDDLIEFAKFMKPDPDRPEDVARSLYHVAKHHTAIAAALEQVEAGKIRRLIINVPPRHGKSELSSTAVSGVVPWPPSRAVDDSRHLRGQALLGLRPRGQRLSWKTRLYRQVFPKLAIKTASVDRIETTQGGKVFFVGRGSAITGRGARRPAHRRPDQGPRRGRQRGNAREAVELVQPGRSHPAAFSRAAGSSSSRPDGREDDLVGRLTDPMNPSYSAIEGPKWKIIDLPAIAVENDRLGRKEGEALWPERFPVSLSRGDARRRPARLSGAVPGFADTRQGQLLPCREILTYGRGDLPKKSTAALSTRPPTTPCRRARSATRPA